MNGSLTVVIPAYNSASTVGDAIQSAFHVGAVKVIVVDDGSTDLTAAVSRDSGAEVLSQVNSGAARARAAGAELVDSEFVIFLDADDTLIERGVRASIDILRGSESVVVAAGAVIGRNQTGREVAYPRAYDEVDVATLVSNGFAPWPPAASVFLNSGVQMARRLTLPPLDARYADDYELLLRLAMVGSVRAHDHPSCHYQIDGGKSARAAARVVDCKERIRAYYGAYNDLSWVSLTDRQRKAIVMARTAHGLRNAGDILGAALLVVRVGLADPAVLLRALKRRVAG